MNTHALRRAGLSAAFAMALAAPALAVDMPPCDDTQITGMVKELAAGVTPEGTKADAAKIAKIAAEITLSDIKELANDATVGKRTCYANPTLMRGEKTKENVFGDVGLEYQVTGDPEKPDAVKIAISTVARRKGK